MGFLGTIKSLLGIKQNGDRKLVCEDCKKPFIFDAGEQRFFKAKGFTDPKRCPRCRKRIKVRIHKKPRNNRNRFRQRPHNRSIIDGESPYADE
ncbi:hypothetical protein BVX98_07940 [bacterium F11]|nr:hypothetical protein BVX98_07940 [bacterium F11]